MSFVGDARAALEGRLSVVTGMPAARAWENTLFIPTTGTAWARLTLTIATIRPAVRGSSPQRRYDGLFIVELFLPEAAGPSAADDLADSVMAAYTVDDVLTAGAANVRFEWAERSSGYSDSPWYGVPVTVKWYSYSGG